MAPPTRHRPHLDDLLQKNLELEHVVADLRHQLTQSFAKWADERKTLATGCDALMASFAKYRARLDIHSSDMVDSEGEIEENLDGERPSEETGEVDSLNRLETDGNLASSVAGDLRERCDALTAELRMKEEELENSQRRHEATQEELRNVQRLLDAQSEELRAVLASAKADTTNDLSPDRLFNDASTQVDPPEGEFNDSLESHTEEINRHRRLLEQWKKYGSDWKRDAQTARARTAELIGREAELKTKVQAAQENQALLEKERKENQRLTSALAEQTDELDHQRTLLQDTLDRVQELEAMVSQLQAQLPPEQLTSNSGQKQAAPEPSSLTKSPAAHADAHPNKHSQKIHLRIPAKLHLVKTPWRRHSDITPISTAGKFVKQPTGENTGLRDGQQSHTLAGSSASANPISQTNNTSPTFNPSDFELCIHTCNVHPCRNESQSILWRRKQASLPRHALSEKKHHRCNPACPGHRLLMMPASEALKEPRRAKCRPPTEADLAKAALEVDRLVSTRKTRVKRAKTEEKTRREGSLESEETEDSEGSEYEEEGGLTRVPMKRLARVPDGEERPRKLRPRSSR